MTALGPAAIALAIAMLLDPIGDLTWRRYGYSITPDHLALLGDAFLIASAVCLAGGLVMAAIAYRRENNFVSAAERLDHLFDGREQIVTLATLADPSAPESARSRRTSLFPVLWRRALMYFQDFDPKKEFKLGVGAPLKRGTVLAGLLAIAMMVATLGLMRAPSPEQAMAAKLRSLAQAIASSATTPEDSALASKVRAAADALENPKIPPQEKKKRIEEAMQQADRADQKRNNSQSGKDKGTGKSNAQSGSGNSQGKGQGSGKSEGSGAGEGQAGSGSGKSGTGQGAGSGKNQNAGSDKSNNNGKNDQNAKADKQNVELQNELAKADAQVESAGAKNPSPDKAGGDKNQTAANQPGSDPNHKGGDQPDPNKPGDIPRPGTHGDRNVPSGGDNKNAKDMGSNLGDTHLGETPAARNYQRFLKPGEKGTPVDIKDARYVMFRIPGAVPSGDGGRTVLDNNRPKASTAYVNAPLAPSSDDAPPDERQLVPPRYRDMIR